MRFSGGGAPKPQIDNLTRVLVNRAMRFHTPSMKGPTLKPNAPKLSFVTNAKYGGMTPLKPVNPPAGDFNMGPEGGE